MRGQAEDAGTQIHAAGWRQGSIVERNSLAALGHQDHDCAIVLSQTCDAVQSVDVEPNIELILGKICDKPRPYCQFGHNSRQLDLSMKLNGEECSIQLHIQKRVLASKDCLSKFRPSAMLDPNNVTLLANWVAKRYTRPAWPDVFNERT